MEELPAALTRRILNLGGSPLTEAQREDVTDAYRANPGSLERAVAGAETAGHPTAYFVSSVRRIKQDERTARTAAPARRHDLDEPLCRDCGDTGFVILTRDVGENALAGDAAPCHCDSGVEKQRRYGTVHYGPDDYAPAVPGSTSPEKLLTLQEYAQTEFGKNDPHLEAMRALWKKQRILKDIEP